MPSYLPPEILGNIAESLHEDHQTLRQFSCICRASVDPCRRLLFRTIRLYEETKETNSRRRSPGDFTPCDRLYHVIQPNSHLTLYIRELFVYGSEPALGSTTLAPLLQLMADAGCLQTFSFDTRYRGWFTFPHALRASFTNILSSPRLHTLRILMEDVAWPDLTLKVLSFTPSLTHLAYCCGCDEDEDGWEDDSADESEPEDHASISGSNDPEQPRVEHTRYLTTLEIGDPAPWSIVKALSSASSLISLSNLQSLVIHRSSSGETRQAAQKVMSLTSGTLKQLSWVLPLLRGPHMSPRMTVATKLPARMDLTTLHHVREVTIYHNNYSEDNLLISLRTCGLPPNIEIFSLVVDFNPHAVPTFRSGNVWARRIDNELIEILDTAKYTQLRSIRMRVPHRPEYTLSGSGLDAEIRDRFPKFCAMEMFEGTAVEFDPLRVHDTKTAICLAGGYR